MKILDFGIARGDGASSGPAALRSSAASRGTLAYLAPEVLRGGPVDVRADVYSLGAVLRELVRNVEAPHERLSETIDRAAADDPRARFVTAAALADALDELCVPATTAPAQPMLDLTHRTVGSTAPIVRIATRPLASAAPARSERAHGRATTPARGVAVAPRRLRSRGGRITRAVVTTAIVGIVLGAALVVGQALVSMSTPRATGSLANPTLLAPPRDLAAAASCDGMFSTGVDLTWAAVASAQGYEVWRRGSVDGYVLVARLRGEHTEVFRDADLGVDAAYAYRVRAFDGPRVSRWSNVAEAATPLLCLT